MYYIYDMDFNLEDDGFATLSDAVSHAFERLPSDDSAYLISERIYGEDEEICIVFQGKVWYPNDTKI